MQYCKGQNQLAFGCIAVDMLFEGEGKLYVVGNDHWTGCC